MAIRIVTMSARLAKGRKESRNGNLPKRACLVDHVSRSKQKENPRVFAQLDPARRGKTPCTSKIRSPQGRVSRTRQDQPGEFCQPLHGICEDQQAFMVERR